MSIYQQIVKVRDELKITLDESKALGERWAILKAQYESTKSRRALEMKEQGFTASMIELTIKGDADVSQAMMERDIAEVQYKNACEGVNVLKKEFDYLREQYQREWTQSGWSDR